MQRIYNHKKYGIATRDDYYELARILQKFGKTVSVKYEQTDTGRPKVYYVEYDD